MLVSAQDNTFSRVQLFFFFYLTLNILVQVNTWNIKLCLLKRRCLGVISIDLALLVECPIHNGYPLNLCLIIDDEDILLLAENIVLAAGMSNVHYCTLTYTLVYSVNSKCEWRHIFSNLDFSVTQQKIKRYKTVSIQLTKNFKL